MARLDKKQKLLGNFEKILKIFDENSIEKLNFIIIFRKFVPKNRAFGNNTIYAQILRETGLIAESLLKPSLFISFGAKIPNMLFRTISSDIRIFDWFLIPMLGSKVASCPGAYISSTLLYKNFFIRTIPANELNFHSPMINVA